MIADLLPHQIRVFYLKIKMAVSLKGFLDALRELLDELEYCTETKKSFLTIKKLFDSQECLWKKDCVDSLGWVSEKLKVLKTSQYMGSRKIIEFIEQKEAAIRSGNPGMFQGGSYLEMQLSLLEEVSNMIAEYGHYQVIKDWCQPLKNTSQVMSLKDDPFLDQNIEGTILPDSPEGTLLEKTLGHGFIEAEVIGPNWLSTERKYNITRGHISFKYPSFLKDCKERIIDKIPPEISDKRPTILLHKLIVYAYYHDWMNTEPKLPKKKSENDLIASYNIKHMKEHLLLAFNLKKAAENIRIDLSSILDRFLIFVLQESHESSLSDRDRALKYAYSKVKDRLIRKTEDERIYITYAEITEWILSEAKLDMLPYVVCKQHGNDACKKFAKEYGWKPIRKSAQKKRVSPT